MKNIILQHYTGMTTPLEDFSIKNIKKYATKLNVEYKFIDGDVFDPSLTHPCQKLIMLDKQFDDYDTVVMFDIDMFTRKGMNENIFEVPGIGMHTEFQASLHQKMKSRKPHLTNMNFPYWGGAIWKLTREQRQLLRKGLGSWVKEFSGQYEDEGIMHRLATLANFKPAKPYLPNNFHWCHCSYRKGIQSAAMIHIRTKVTPTGPTTLKINNYNNMVRQGLIEE